MKIEIKLDKTSLFTEHPEEVVETFFEISSEILTSEIKKHTPVDYGKLRGSWTPKQSKTKLVVSNSRNYALFVEKGTGIFGPKRHRIFPRSAKVLHANIKGKDVFFRHSRGQAGKHMAEKGVLAYQKQIPKLLRTALIQITEK